MWARHGRTHHGRILRFARNRVCRWSGSRLRRSPIGRFCRRRGRLAGRSQRSECLRPDAWFSAPRTRRHRLLARNWLHRWLHRWLIQHLNQACDTHPGPRRRAFEWLGWRRREWVAIRPHRAWRDWWEAVVEAACGWPPLFAIDGFNWGGLLLQR